MDGQTRRKKLIELVRQSDKPVSGTALAAALDVSRQVVVTDIALIRANGVDIISTNRGYIINAQLPKCSRVIKCRHTDDEILDELFTIVDNGGCAENIIINHRYYRAIIEILSYIIDHLLTHQGGCKCFCQISILV